MKTVERVSPNNSWNEQRSNILPDFYIIRPLFFANVKLTVTFPGGPTFYEFSVELLTMQVTNNTDEHFSVKLYYSA